MNIALSEVVLRPLEERDLEALRQYKNDAEIASLLVGFSSGYSRQGMSEWLARHTGRADEVVWAVAEPLPAPHPCSGAADRCIGHAGLYRIDGRTRSCEFGILIGDKSFWGRGVGREVTEAAVEYAFGSLNLRRVSLQVLAVNTRARKVYERAGFQVEGVLQEAEYRDGSYLDVVLMARRR